MAAAAGAGAEFKALHCPLAAVNGNIYALAGRTHTDTDSHSEPEERARA